MKFPCTISRRPDGRWSIRHSGNLAGTVEVVADSRPQALEKMRGELQYRLELCPCSGQSYQHIQIEIDERVG